MEPNINDVQEAVEVLLMVHFFSYIVVRTAGFLDMSNRNRGTKTIYRTISFLISSLVFISFIVGTSLIFNSLIVPLMYEEKGFSMFILFVFVCMISIWGWVEYSDNNKGIFNLFNSLEKSFLARETYYLEKNILQTNFNNQMK